MNTIPAPWYLLEEDPGILGSMLVPVGGMLLIFYFILWRPQARERKNREAMLGALKAGDKVITTSGILGTVASIKDQEVVVKVDEKNNVKLRMTRPSIQTVLGDPAAESKAPAETSSK